MPRTSMIWRRRLDDYRTIQHDSRPTLANTMIPSSSVTFNESLVRSSTPGPASWVPTIHLCESLWPLPTAAEVKKSRDDLSSWVQEYSRQPELTMINTLKPSIAPSAKRGRDHSCQQVALALDQSDSAPPKPKASIQLDTFIAQTHVDQHRMTTSSDLHARRQHLFNIRRHTIPTQRFVHTSLAR